MSSLYLASEGTTDKPKSHTFEYARVGYTIKHPSLTRRHGTVVVGMAQTTAKQWPYEDPPLITTGHSRSKE